MRLLEQVLVYIILAFNIAVSEKDKDEGRPYEFGFTIDGQQHRLEKKDQNGIIQGEFGFITGDGVYHVTVYATDENGSFKILSMRNIRISAPLDGSPAWGPISPEAGKYLGKLGLSTAAPAPPSQRVQKFERIQQQPVLPQSIDTTTRKTIREFTTQPTIKPACGGCGYVTTAKPLVPGKLPPLQLFEPQGPNVVQNGISDHQKAVQTIGSAPGFPVVSVSPQQPSGGLSQVHEAGFPRGPGINSQQVQKVPAFQTSPLQGQPLQPSPPQGQPPQPPIRPPPDVELLPPGYVGPNGPAQELGPNYSVNQNGPGQEARPSYPSQPVSGDVQSHQALQSPNKLNQYELDDRFGGNQDQSSPLNAPPFGTGPNPLLQKGDLSKLPPIAVSDNVIRVGGKRPQNIPIKDKYPGMVDGLPKGVEETDVKDILYKFKYTVGFHGHYERGLKNGAKIGGYFVNGRDGYSRVVTYVADENGYRPKFKLINLGLDSPETPKEGTERTFGLKEFEFVWYPLN